MSWTVKLPDWLRTEVRKLTGSAGESPEQFVVRVLEKELRQRRHQESHLFRPYRYGSPDPGEEAGAPDSDEEFVEFSVN